MPASQESRNISATILNTATKSAAIALGGVTLTGLITPAALTGVAFTFEVSADGTTFVPLYDSTGTQESMTVAVSQGYSLNPQVFSNWAYVKVVSGSAEGADRVIVLVARPFQ